MKLKRLLLRYDPPGVGLEIDDGGLVEVRHKALPPTEEVTSAAHVCRLVDELIAGDTEVLTRKKHTPALRSLLGRLYEIDVDPHEATERDDTNNDTDTLMEGSIVVLVRLKGALMAHNGEVVTVTKARPEKDKYEVFLPAGRTSDSSETLKVKGSDHLVLVAPKGTQLNVGGLVCIRGLRNHLELNGSLGRIVECHPENHRYEVRATDSGQLFRVKQENLLPVGVEEHHVDAPMFLGADGAADEVATGSMVELHGLKSAMQYNGQTAEVMSIDRSRGRYEIMMTDGAVKTVRAENVRLVGCKTSPRTRRCRRRFRTITTRRSTSSLVVWERCHRRSAHVPSSTPLLE